MVVNVLRIANNELDESINYYKKIDIELSNDFIDEVINGINQIKRNPLQYPLSDNSTRTYQLRKFPFSILFEIKSEMNSILIVAFMHQRRSPKNLIGRI